MQKGSVKRRKGFGSVVADLLLRLEAAAKTHRFTTALCSVEMSPVSRPTVRLSARPRTSGL